ncbi:hypothetical protein Sulac_0524 [Sulfobacillus acidophilus DSM 10332]|uniref:Uncharacterized protein n=1 Tax=Sulfobacillus acidophilus (strain ATCC 700253 / DSM 10332 / NAL) TaxID=679936 RepID=G8TZ96_SULAD|nr:hypothetical protein Sulac_0524 [Sulfobacillus acidophilus DSM 10332]
MQVMVPAEYRQNVRWFLNLDAGSFALLVGGAAVGFSVLKGHAPLAERIPESLAVLGLTIALAVVRWPIDHGDRATTWLRRGWEYYWRAKRGSAWGAE